MIRRQLRAAREYERRAADRSRPGTPALLLSGSAHGEGLAPQANHRWVQLLARLSSSRLDGQLAAGVPPESSPLAAARAERLVSFPMRSALAQHWGDVLARAARPPPAARPPVVPLCRGRIIAARRDIQELLGALSTQLPVPARGVAAANRLLTDGTGPLYNPACTTDLSEAMRKVVELLDPATALVSSS